MIALPHPANCHRIGDVDLRCAPAHTCALAASLDRWSTAIEEHKR